MVVSSCRELKTKNSRPLLETVLINLAHIGELLFAIKLIYMNKKDNTEGSWAIIQTFRVRKNLRLCLSKKQMSIILGSVLGDAYIYPKGKICFEHGEKQRNYLLWKFSQLKSAACPKVSQVKRWDNRINKHTISYRFFLRQYFRTLRKIFYPNKKKIIPKQIKAWLSPLLLAVWYMDDGYLERKKYPLLMTESFNSDNLSLLKRILFSKLNIDTKINNRNRIRIKSRNKFFSLINSHMHESMNYKLP